MRRYSLISLAIGGSVLVLILVLHYAGVYDASARWFGEMYESRGWLADVSTLPSRWLEIPAAALAAFGVAWAVVEISRPIEKIVAVCGSVLVLLTLSPACALYGAFLNPAAPMSALVLSAVAGFLYANTPAGKRKRLLEEALGLRVSTKVFSTLLEAPSEPILEGVQRGVTTLVCRFFPPDPGEVMGGPSEVLKMGSLFLRSVSTFLLARGAYLEEAGPECVRVSFGILRDGDDGDDGHADEACRAALDLRIRLRGLGQEFEARWFHTPRYGIGIESTHKTVGFCGTPGRFFFTAVGGNGDLASRLAFANLRFGSDLLLGPAAFRLVRDRFEVRPMEMVYDPVGCCLQEIYQILSLAGVLSEEERARRDHFWRGVVLLREKEIDAALEAFSRARVSGAEDGPLAYFLAKAQDGVASPESRPLRLVRDLTEEGHARLIDRL